MSSDEVFIQSFLVRLTVTEQVLSNGIHCTRTIFLVGFIQFTLLIDLLLLNRFTDTSETNLLEQNITVGAFSHRTKLLRVFAICQVTLLIPSNIQRTLHDRRSNVNGKSLSSFLRRRCSKLITSFSHLTKLAATCKSSFRSSTRQHITQTSTLRQINTHCGGQSLRQSIGSNSQFLTHSFAGRHYVQSKGTRLSKLLSDEVINGFPLREEGKSHNASKGNCCCHLSKQWSRIPAISNLPSIQPPSTNFVVSVASEVVGHASDRTKSIVHLGLLKSTIMVHSHVSKPLGLFK